MQELSFRVQLLTLTLRVSELRLELSYVVLDRSVVSEFGRKFLLLSHDRLIELLDVGVAISYLLHLILNFTFFAQQILLYGQLGAFKLLVVLSQLIHQVFILLYCHSLHLHLLNFMLQHV